MQPMHSTKDTKKRVLGRGLGALLKDYNNPEIWSENGNFFKMIPIKCIVVNPFQPRKDFSPKSLHELKDSIKLHGIIQPLTVSKLTDKTYQLIAGERRLRAAELADLEEVPAYVRVTDDQQLLELALIENIQRESLNAIEIALSYHRLITECNVTQEVLAMRVGKDRTTVNNYLRLLRLPPAIQAALRDRKISMGHARALINLPFAEKQLSCLRQIIEKSLSVRQVENLVKSLSTKTLPEARQYKSVGDDFKFLLKHTSAQLGKKIHTQVSIKADEHKKGVIKIAFNSDSELNRIVSMLLNIQK